MTPATDRLSRNYRAAGRSIIDAETEIPLEFRQRMARQFFLAARAVIVEAEQNEVRRLTSTLEMERAFARRLNAEAGEIIPHIVKVILDPKSDTVSLARIAIAAESSPAVFQLDIVTLAEHFKMLGGKL